MKFLAWMLIFLSAGTAGAQVVKPQESPAPSSSSLFQKVSTLFSEGRYGAAVEELKSLEDRLMKYRLNNKQNIGRINYWKGISYSRLQDFPEAIKSFEKALSLDFAPVDIHYEYGQALYAAEKLQDARIQFRESLRRKYKRGVSLYYIAFISKELGDKKKAHTFFKSISKLKDAEAQEVLQASEMQIGDIYLEQVETRRDPFKSIEEYVIPQYRRAHAVDPDSSLAPIILDKIVKLQRKYDLVLFQLRNGRPALYPPYFLRLSQEVGKDTNVTFSPAETTISTSKQDSLYSKTDVYGRYTFYYRDYLSISPEMRFNYTYYFNRVPEIYKNDNYLLAPAIRTAYEYTLWKKPAAFLFDYDYTEARRDVNAREELDFSSRAHTLMAGQRFNFWESGESVVRLRHRILQSYLTSSDSQTTSFVFEHVQPLQLNTILYYFSYDRMRVEDEAFDTDSLTFRADVILPRIRDWFTPSFGLALTSTDPVNNRDLRGRELLINPSARLTKTFKRNMRAHLKYEYQQNNSKDESNFAYKKSLYALEFEYLF